LSDDMFNKLVVKAKEFIEKHGTVTYDEMAKWANAENISAITLSVIIEELLSRGVVEAEGEFFTPPELSFPLFKKSIPKALRVKSLKPSELKPPVDISHPEEVGVNVQPSIEVSRVEVDELLKDPEMRKVIEYLNEHWSVGDLRIMGDLEKMGIQNPRRLIRKLLDLELITYHPNGVFDITDKLPRIRRKKTLADFLI